MQRSNGFWKLNGSLIIFIIALVLVFVFLYFFRSELLPFAIGLVLASIIQPAIKWISDRLPKKGKLAGPLRVVIIFVLMIVFLLVIAALFFLFVLNVIAAFSHLISNAPQFFTDISQSVSTWVDSIKQKIPFNIDLSQITSSLGDTLGGALKSLFGTAFSFMPTTLGLILGFVTLPLFIFFILKDSVTIKKDFYYGLPRTFYKHANEIMSIIGRILGQYIRALLYSSIIVSILLTIALKLAGLDFSLALSLAVFAGFCEWIPPIGQWISLIFGLIVVLAVAPNLILWAIIAYVVVILIDNVLLSGTFHGKYLKINPGIMMVLMVLGSTIAGIWGMILINPFAQTILEIYKYIRDELQKEEPAT